MSDLDSPSAMPDGRADDLGADQLSMLDERRPDIFLNDLGADRLTLLAAQAWRRWEDAIGSTPDQAPTFPAPNRVLPFDSKEEADQSPAEQLGPERLLQLFAGDPERPDDVLTSDDVLDLLLALLADSFEERAPAWHLLRGELLLQCWSRPRELPPGVSHLLTSLSLPSRHHGGGDDADARIDLAGLLTWVRSTPSLLHDALLQLVRWLRELDGGDAGAFPLAGAQLPWSGRGCKEVIKRWVTPRVDEPEVRRFLLDALGTSQVTTFAEWTELHEVAVAELLDVLLEASDDAGRLDPAALPFPADSLTSLCAAARGGSLRVLLLLRQPLGRRNLCFRIERTGDESLPLGVDLGSVEGRVTAGLTSTREAQYWWESQRLDREAHAAALLELLGELLGRQPSLLTVVAQALDGGPGAALAEHGGDGLAKLITSRPPLLAALLEHGGRGWVSSFLTRRAELLETVRHLENPLARLVALGAIGLPEGQEEALQACQDLVDGEAGPLRTIDLASAIDAGETLGLAEVGEFVSRYPELGNVAFLSKRFAAWLRLDPVGAARCIGLDHADVLDNDERVYLLREFTSRWPGVALAADEDVVDQIATGSEASAGGSWAPLLAERGRLDDALVALEAARKGDRLHGLSGAAVEPGSLAGLLDRGLDPALVLLVGERCWSARYDLDSLVRSRDLAGSQALLRALVRAIAEGRLRDATDDERKDIRTRDREGMVAALLLRGGFGECSPDDVVAAGTKLMELGWVDGRRLTERALLAAPAPARLPLVEALLRHAAEDALRAEEALDLMATLGKQHLAQVDLSVLRLLNPRPRNEPPFLPVESLVRQLAPHLDRVQRQSPLDVLGERPAVIDQSLSAAGSWCARDRVFLAPTLVARFEGNPLDPGLESDLAELVVMAAAEVVRSKLPRALAAVGGDAPSPESVLRALGDRYPDRARLETALLEAGMTDDEECDKVLDRCADELLPRLARAALAALIEHPELPWGSPDDPPTTRLLSFVLAAWAEQPAALARVLHDVLRRSDATTLPVPWFRGLVFALGKLREPIGGRVPKLLRQLASADGLPEQLRATARKQADQYGRHRLAEGRSRRAAVRTREAEQSLKRAQALAAGSRS